MAASRLQSDRAVTRGIAEDALGGSQPLGDAITQQLGDEFGAAPPHVDGLAHAPLTIAFEVRPRIGRQVIHHRHTLARGPGAARAGGCTGGASPHADRVRQGFVKARKAQHHRDACAIHALEKQLSHEVGFNSQQVSASHVLRKSSAT